MPFEIPLLKVLGFRVFRVCRVVRVFRVIRVWGVPSMHATAPSLSRHGCDWDHQTPDTPASHSKDSMSQTHDMHHSTAVAV